MTDTIQHFANRLIKDGMCLEHDIEAEGGEFVTIQRLVPGDDDEIPGDFHKDSKGKWVYVTPDARVARHLSPACFSIALGDHPNEGMQEVLDEVERRLDGRECEIELYISGGCSEARAAMLLFQEWYKNVCAGNDNLSRISHFFPYRLPSEGGIEKTEGVCDEIRFLLRIIGRRRTQVWKEKTKGVKNKIYFVIGKPGTDERETLGMNKKYCEIGEFGEPGTDEYETYVMRGLSSPAYFLRPSGWEILLEYCSECGAETGKLLRAEDSIYLYSLGPLCDTCAEFIQSAEDEKPLHTRSSWPLPRLSYLEGYCCADRMEWHRKPATKHLWDEWDQQQRSKYIPECAEAVHASWKWENLTDGEVIQIREKARSHIALLQDPVKIKEANDIVKEFQRERIQSIREKRYSDLSILCAFTSKNDEDYYQHVRDRFAFAVSYEQLVYLGRAATTQGVTDFIEEKIWDKTWPQYGSLCGLTDQETENDLLIDRMMPVYWPLMRAHWTEIHTQEAKKWRPQIERKEGMFERIFNFLGGL